MFFTTTFTVALLLIFVALANFFWLFLMPSKGEKHPLVETISEMERTIKRSEDHDEIDWGAMRKQVQQQRMQLNLLRADQYMQVEEVQKLQNVLDSLYSYVEGNWHLYEMGDDPEIAKKFYDESMDKIKDFPEHKFSVTVLLDPKNEETKKIDISKSLRGLYKQVRNQRMAVEKQYGLS